MTGTEQQNEGQGKGLRPGTEELAVESREDLIAQAFVAPAPEGPPGLDEFLQDMDLERPETFPEEDEWKSPPRAQGSILEDGGQEAQAIQSPEATTPVTDNHCRRCGFIRTEVVPYCCQCGETFWDSKRAESRGENSPGKRTAVMLDMRPMLNAEELNAPAHH